MTTPTAKTYARFAVARIGYDVLVSPYWAHELYIWTQARIPDFVKITHYTPRLALKPGGYARPKGAT